MFQKISSMIPGHLGLQHNVHCLSRGLTCATLTTIAVLALSSCARRPKELQAVSPQTHSPVVTSIDATPGRDSSMTAVRFLENRVKKDPDDLVAINKLANYYLQLYRETYDVTYLQLALHSARSSLSVLGVDQNLSGLLALAQAEYATHDFALARDHAKQLTEYQPQKSYGYQVLGDALLELGEYEQATQAYK